MSTKDLLDEIEETAKGIKGEKDADTGNAVKVIDKIFEEAEEKTKLDSESVVKSVTGLTKDVDKQTSMFVKAFGEIKSALKDLAKSVSDRPKTIETIVKNPTKFPGKMKISNLKDIPTEKVVEVKEPSWIKKLQSGDVLKDIQKALIKGPINVKVENDDPKRPIAVRLSDGKMFYRAIGAAVAAGVAVFRDSSGNNTSVKLDSLGHVPTDVLNKLVPEHFDYLDLTMTGANLTKVEYYTGGAGGTVVATLDIAYDGSNNIDTVTKT